VSTPEEQSPAVRVHGPATPEDVAAIVAVLAAAGGGTHEPDPPASTWASHRAALRQPLEHGPAAWRSSYRR
jgi:acyl-CoA carboxylase epsilon subunit